MPDKTPCLHCQRIGFVRLEHVIKARMSATDYYCGHCNHAWSVAGDPARRTPRARRPTADDRPGRARA